MSCYGARVDQRVDGPGPYRVGQGEGDKLIMLCAAQGRYFVSGATAVAPASMDAARVVLSDATGVALVNAARVVLSDAARVALVNAVRVALSGAARAALFGAAGAARRRCHE